MTPPVTAFASNLNAIYGIRDGVAVARDFTTIVPIIRGRLPGELLAGVSEPLFGVPVDLYPSEQRRMVERPRPQRSRDRGLADDGAKLGGAQRGGSARHRFGSGVGDEGWTALWTAEMDR